MKNKNSSIIASDQKNEHIQANKSTKAVEKFLKNGQSIDDIDPIETREWIQSIENVIKEQGAERAEFLIKTISEKFFEFSQLPLALAKEFSKSLFSNLTSLGVRNTINTPYVNTISPDEEASFPGNLSIERSISNAIRWNAMAMVLRANKKSDGIGGHIATYASSATLYDVGYNHFFKGPTKDSEGDAVFFQGHASPGVYARAFIEGRLDEKDLENFRRELAANGGLPSYPHPRLMPDFWQFPTVSMGLGPLMAIALARFKRYLHNRGIKDTSQSHVYAFIGDGETDEVETLGNLALAAREQLDNLTFIINCNLQRLDGPVRGNGHIIQELESIFLGAGWNVIKVIWSSDWDEILENDEDGSLRKLFLETVDGEFQLVSTLSGADRRKKYFSKYPQVEKLVAHLSDEQLEKLRRGGHDEIKVYSAYHRATTQKNGRPTVILAKTVKGYGMSESGEGRNTAHQQKKMSEESLESFRKRFDIPVKDLEKKPFFRFDKDSAEAKYLKDLRKKAGPMVPMRNTTYKSFQKPSPDCYERVIAGSGQREVSTTMAFVQILSSLLKDKNVARYIVPIVPDESRTFGMEGLFRQYGIFSIHGQLYTPVDKNSLMAYTELKNGQIYQEGIDEAGAMATFIAAGTSYSTHSTPMLPFYIYYSMFGFQRTGDLIWAASDMKTKGFLIGGTAGRTTLNGEGLQHEDGHSHILASTVPSIFAYDLAYGFEIAVVVEDGIEKMYINDEDGLYYLTVYNENYVQPPPPRPLEEIKEGITKGIYLYNRSAAKKKDLQVSILASGISVETAKKASDTLKKKYGIDTLIYSATSFKKLRDEAIVCERHNMLNPSKKQQVPYITQVLQDDQSDLYLGVSDYMRLYADFISRFVPGPWFSLGTDGFGRSSSREELRKYFETDQDFIVIATLYQLFLQKKISQQVVDQAFKEMKIDKDKAYGLGLA